MVETLRGPSSVPWVRPEGPESPTLTQHTHTPPKCLWGGLDEGKGLSSVEGVLPLRIRRAFWDA